MIISLLTTLCLAQGTSFKTVKIVQGIKPLNFAAASSGSKVAMTTDDGQVRIFDASAGATVKALGKHPQAAYGIAWSADGKYIASGDETARIWLWDASSGKKLKEMRTHTRGIQKLSFNRSRSLLLSTGKDDSMRLYDPSAGKEKKVIQGNGANFYGGQFFPNSDSFAVATLTEGGRIYKGGNVVALKGHGGQGAFEADVNKAGSRIATAGKDAKIILWNSSGGAVATLVGHMDIVANVRFSPNGRLLASSCGSDRTVKIWDVASGKAIATISDSSAVGSPLGWTADGRFLLSTDVNDNLRITAVSPAQGGGGAAPKKARKRR